MSITPIIPKSAAMSQPTVTNGVPNGAPLPLLSDHSSRAAHLSSDPQLPNDDLTEGCVPSTSKAAKPLDSEESRPERKFDEHWNAAYQARFAHGRKHPFVMSHKTIHFPDDPGLSLMSWWPIPDNPEYFQAPKDDGISTKPTGKKEDSLIKKLEHRLGELIFGAGEHQHSGGKIQPNGTQDTSKSNNLYNVVLTLTHMQKDVDSTLQGVRVCGTYDSLPAAKASAHRCLFDAGYEQDWFITFETQHEGILVDHKQNEIVKAVCPSGEEFIVSISAIPNVFKLKANDGGRIEMPLYHVVQTIVHYRADESGQTRDTTIQGSFENLEEARKVALSTLLWGKDGISRNTYARYDEAGPDELDCGYGENVIVHAIGQNGENFLVSVLKGHPMESELVSEAAAAMRL
jgi:hypothetical protein